MKLHFCDCGCEPCREQAAPHLPCSWECVEVLPMQPDRTRVIGGRSGREIITIE